MNVLLQGCHIVLPQGPHPQSGSSDPPLPQGWDILWKFIEAHYGCHGILRYFHSGTTSFLTSQSGVQQGDPLGSTLSLFALAIHPLLLQIGQDVPTALITAHADNVIIAGPLSAALQAHKAYHSDHTSMTAADLTINDLESELYVAQWSDMTLQNLASASADLSPLAQSQPPMHIAC